MPGRFIVAEGNEGAGKSFFLAEVEAWAKRENKRLFSLIDFCAREHRHPLPEELEGYDALLSQEPSPAWTGSAIRHEMVKQHDRTYTGRQIAEAFGLDRLVLYQRVIRPALDMGLHVFSDRSVASSLVYQPITEPGPIPLDEVMTLDGNALALSTPIHAMAIYLVDPEVGHTRAHTREKQDDAIYEQVAFMKQLDERYRSDWFHKIFSERGTTLETIDTTKTTIEETQQLTHKFLERALS